MLSAVIKDEKTGIERLDKVFVKDECKDELDNTTDDELALSNTIVHEKLA